MRIVVVGGGVSGLAAARLLAGGRAVSGAGADSEGAFGPCRVVLLEASGRLGGKVRTSAGDTAFELGPDQFLKRDPSVVNLCRHLGLGGELVEPAAGTAAVFARQAPRQLPSGLVLGVPTDVEALAASGIVSDEAVAFAAGEAARPGHELSAAEVGLDNDGGAGAERSVGDVLRPRLGDEIVDRLTDPLLGGINAGSVDALSLGTTAPQLATALVGHSDVMAPLAALAPRRPEGPAAPGSPQTGDARSGSRPKTPGPSPFFGLVGGLGRMIDALALELTGLGCEVRLNSPVGRISQKDGGYAVSTAAGELQADAVVLAVPAFVAAELLGELAPAAASALGSIRYATVAVATLAYEKGARAALEGWTGVLIPKSEGALATAVTFLSHKWPFMPGVFVRVSAGRHLDDRIAGLGDTALAGRLVDELATYAGIAATPSGVAVTRWERSFPQYEPGHGQRIARCRQALASHPAVALAGASLGGIGIPACVTSGERAVAELLARLSR
ncbi:MAG TPA: protoporphyrinogen oxidase [Acidimicrobiales bacterium]|jgi:oxygen-dependent protoporphyrinogen oxidase|nr:protoporphyrinogen oxidase [Acidimicrobiales bacterium]